VLRLNEAATKILSDTGGKMEIKIFAQSQLGGAAATIGQTRLGAIDMCIIFYGFIEPMEKVAGLASIPFAFATQKDVMNAMDGPFGKYVRAQIEKLNFHVFERAWDIGFRQLSNSLRPIRTPDDLKGMRLRVPPSPASVAVFKAFGTSPTPIDPKEQYVACQTHIVDGTELPMGSLYTYKMYEVQKYLSIINHSWTGHTALMNGDAWRKLPKDVQDAVDRNFNAAGMEERVDMAKVEVTTEQQLVAKGMVSIHPPVAPFKAVIRASGLYATWRQQYGAEGFDLLQKSVGQLV
jgi:tripartite ATP-independent transporter DctP family solute receptor